MKNIIKTLTAVLLVIFTALSMFACADNKEDENSETATKYTITLNSDGGMVEFSEIELSHGDAYLLPIPTKDGYTFDGWLLNGEVFANSGFYNYYEDITLLAKYNQNENGNGNGNTSTTTTTAAPAADDAAASEDDGGCGSVVSASCLVALLTVGMGVTVIGKKKI